MVKKLCDVEQGKRHWQVVPPLLRNDQQCSMLDHRAVPGHKSWLLDMAMDTYAGRTFFWCVTLYPSDGRPFGRTI